MTASDLGNAYAHLQALKPADPQAFMVVTRDGSRAVFLERPPADSYAARTHGVVEPLYRRVPE